MRHKALASIPAIFTRLEIPACRCIAKAHHLLIYFYRTETAWDMNEFLSTMPCLTTVPIVASLWIFNDPLLLYFILPRQDRRIRVLNKAKVICELGGTFFVRIT